MLRRLMAAAGKPRRTPAPDSSWDLVTPRQLFATSGWETRCRRLAGAVPFGDDRLLCRTLARFKMYVSAKDAGLAPHLALDGYWEAWNTNVMIEAVQPGMTCLDIGANVGYFTVLLADLVGPEGRVVAVEPIPETRRYLQQNIALNGYDATTTVLGDAVGAERGEVNLFVPPGEPKNALILDVDSFADWEKHTVAVRPLDELDLERVDFIKIDVEGAEQGVWQGMQDTLDRNPEIVVMMEVNCARYPVDAQAFLHDIETRFPLRSVDFAGHVVPTTAQAVMAFPDDVMLYLKRD